MRPASTLATAPLASDEAVLLYSDGLVERAGESLADGQARLARIAASAVGTRGRTVATALPDRVGELVVERTVREGHTDDVTVLVARGACGARRLAHERPDWFDG